MTALLPRVRALMADRRADEQSDADLVRAFVASRDEQAFATLVRRHGPLVLATARRALGDPADADDVFQAVFLLLARNAGAVRNPAAVAGWLHGVTGRMARTARRAAARRKAHEARAPEPRPSAHCEQSWREVRQLFEDELARLPDRYRVPFVLCVLDTEPRADVARRLGIREGTISSRLTEAKRRLQARLTARGVSLSVVLGAISLPTVAVSAELVARSVRAVTGGPVPAAVATLVRAGTRTMHKVAVAGTLGAMAGLVLVAMARPTDVAGGAPPAAKDSPPAVKEPAPAAKVAVRGTLLDADGKPVANAPIRLWSFRHGDTMPEPKAATDADGKFSFDADRGDLTDEARVAITPPGRPAQWLPLSRFTEEQTLRLPADDVPFTGRIASLENQPLKGVTVQVVRVSNVATGELAAWLDRNVAMRKESYWLNERDLISLPGVAVLPEPKATTDADGRFKLTGFGRDRVLTVRVSGPNVETKLFWVVSRPGGPAGGYIKTPDFNHGVYGPDVTVMLAPSRPLVGTIRDTKTGRPVAGVVVSEVNNHIPRSVTDKDGKYRIDGVPKKSHYGINVAGARGVPYFDHTHMWVADVAGLDPLETNLTIRRGIELTGRVVDRATGKPVRAEAMYFPHKDNDDDRLKAISSDGWKTKPDGTFFLTADAGKGVLCILAADASAFRTVDPSAELARIGNRSMPGGAVHAVIPLDLDEAKPETWTIRVDLEAGKTVKGTVVGPDGKPLAGAKAAGFAFSGRTNVMQSASFSMNGMRSGPTPTRLVLVIHEEKKLGALRPVSGDDGDAIQIKLAPLASAEGRVMKGGKEPWGDLTVTAVPSVPNARQYENLPSDVAKLQGLLGLDSGPWRKWTTRTAKTDTDGKFRLDDLLPGLTYTVYVSDGDLGEPNTLVLTKSGVTVEAGKATELGELKK